MITYNITSIKGEYSLKCFIKSQCNLNLCSIVLIKLIFDNVNFKS